MFALRRVSDHLDRHFAEPITLDALARLAGMSLSSFSSRSTDLVGESPSAYQTGNWPTLVEPKQFTQEDLAKF